MPKMDGLQLLASIKGCGAMAAHPGRDDYTTEGGETKVSEAVKLGAAGYVRKPFTADQIKEKLAGILEPALPLMNLNEIIVKSMSESTLQVFSTMLDAQLSSERGRSGNQYAGSH